MKLIKQIVIVGFAALFLFVFTSPVKATGNTYSAEVDHTNHYNHTTEVATHNTPMDCADVCLQNLRSNSSPAITREVKQVQDKQQRRNQSPAVNVSPLITYLSTHEHNQPPPPIKHSFVTEEIHVYICTYLL